MTKPAQTAADTYYRRVFEGLGIALIAGDRNLRIRSWNPAASRLLGASALSMNDTPLTSLIPRERRAEAQRMLEEVVSQGTIHHLEFAHRDQHGAQRELIATMSPVLGEQNDITGVSLCMRDITKRIDLQNEIHQHRRMASLGELAGAVSHHFNNILGGIVTSVDFAVASDDAAFKSRVLDQIGRSLQRATALIDNLLLFSEGAQSDEDYSDFTEVVLELADAIEPHANRQGVSVKVELPDMPVLPIPRMAVRTSLRNVLDNALDAMPDGGTLTMQVELEKDFIILRVMDTGTGIAPEHRERIFDPFWTTKGELGTGVGRSVGMGLAVAHGLLHLTGGSILVEESTDAGTCIRMAIPRNDLPDA